MSGNIYSFTIEQGVTFNRVITWKDEAGNPIDMTGMSARMEIRTRDGLLLATPIVTVDPTDGRITASLTDEETKALSFSTSVYDIEISKDGQVIKRLLKGIVTLDPESTENEVA